jgi:general secretion pathway protein M
MKARTSVAPLLAPVRARWTALGPRERTLVLVTLALIGLALVWWVAIAPALRTLRQADAQHRDLAAQIAHMQRLQAQAQSIQAQPKISRDDAVRALEASVRQRLNTTAQLNIAGDRATVTLRNTAADQLAQWLSQARVNARAIPSEARLVRSASGPPGRLGWDGTVVLNLPPP